MKTYKYRLYGNPGTLDKLQWVLDRARELYNAGLQERRDAYEIAVKRHPNYYDEEARKQLAREHAIGYYEQKRELVDIKEVRPEYQEIASHVLQDVILRLKKAYEHFFQRVQNGEQPGYPRYQGRNRYDSFTYPDGAGWKLEGKKLHLSKIGTVKIKLHREIQGQIKTVTIKREHEQWYVCFSCEVEPVKQTPYTDEAIGVDLGLYHFAALSTGDLIESPRYYRASEEKIARLQQQIARKRKGSHRQKKAYERLRKAHRKVRHQRQDFLHQWSHRLVKTYELIAFEDLTPSNMSKKPQTRQDEATGTYLPNGASQKAGLNKSIRDAGWSTFVTMCQSKAACAGVVQVIKADPYKTSQVCSACHKEGPHKDLSERVHTCENCGLVLDRDVNAAINILAVSQGLNLHPEPKKKTKKVRARTEPSEDAPLRSSRRKAGRVVTEVLRVI
jgi:putative transposase